MIFCAGHGFSWDEVYNWNVDEFADAYQAMQRNHARDILSQFSLMQQSFGGTKKSVKDFVASVSVWLPKQEKDGGAKGTQDFVDLVQKGVKLKKN
jgi:hypothetical protein